MSESSRRSIWIGTALVLLTCATSPAATPPAQSTTGEFTLVIVDHGTPAPDVQVGVVTVPGRAPDDLGVTNANGELHVEHAAPRPRQLYRVIVCKTAKGVVRIVMLVTSGEATASAPSCANARQLGSWTWGETATIDLQTGVREGLPSARSPTPPNQNPHHIFLVVPAYHVEYGKGVPPLMPHQKFDEFVEATYDPIGMAFSGAEALLLEHSNQDGFCGYGHGLGGYAKCYGAARLDATVSGAIGDYLLPVWMHQDPRYFPLGHEAPIGRRILYALSRVVVTRSDVTGRPVVDSSALTGTVIAGALSNLYYPHSDRGLRLTASRIGLDLAGTAAFNLEAEFWQDIATRVFRHRHN